MRSAITAAASSSRLARPRSSLCAACVRHLHSSTPLSVFRPQEPYECPRPTIDAYGHPALPFDQRWPKVSDADELDPVWDKLCEETEKREGVWHELQTMAEPVAKGFYERYGAHDGYGLRNRERWRKDAEGKMEPWSAAGSGWKEVLGFKRGSVRPGRRVEVEGFKHRDSARLEAADERGERERLRVEYVQPRGVSWGVRGREDRAAIASPEGGDGFGDGEESSDRWQELSKRGKELENIAQTLERARLHDLEVEREEAARDGVAFPDGQDEYDDDPRSADTPTRKQLVADWEASQRAKEGSEWTGESDFDPRSETPVTARHRPSKRQLEAERNLPPHLQAGSSTAAMRIGGVREQGFRADRDRSDRAPREPGQFVPRTERQTHERSGPRARNELQRGPGSAGFGIRRNYSTGPRQSPTASRPRNALTGMPLQHRKAPPRAAQPSTPPTTQAGSTTSKSVEIKNQPAAGASEDGVDAQGRRARAGRKPPAEHWRPTKKLTYSAMAGLRELHATDPEQYTRQYLAVKFGISFEAVCRILKSSWRENGVKRVKQDPGFVASGTTAREEKSLVGTKWDVRPETSLEHSPVHAIRQASGRGQ